ncbi:hypothetical protein HIM_11940 [Hirsutella minnesotensis 3608]|uniref:BAH domain-containing protein n=1 Tax=Hirsutella minnesotensis 3608 TaxID=1043627 RepID=A0A0F7ZQY4_9HYPO|nr:hypothetical protein HIM_11940 [Hirsutella minnesotensis 3608]
MISRRQKCRRIGYGRHAECPFLAKISSPREEPSHQTKKRKRGVQDKDKSELVQSSPFVPKGRFKTHPTLDVTYSVKPYKRWSNLTRYRSFVLNGVKYYTGDFVLIANDKTVKRQEAANDDLRDENNPDLADYWVAKILEIRALDESHVYARVYWMYSPDELPENIFVNEQLKSGCSAPSYRHNELIASNHMDIINVVSVAMRTVVHHRIGLDDGVVPDELHWRQALDCRTWELSSLDSRWETDNAQTTKAPTLDACVKDERLANNQEARLSLDIDVENGNFTLLQKAGDRPESSRLLAQARLVAPRGSPRLSVYRNHINESLRKLHDESLKRQEDSLTDPFEPQMHFDLRTCHPSQKPKCGNMVSHIQTSFDTSTTTSVDVSSLSKSSRVSQAAPSGLDIYLPSRTQHQLLAHLQHILELACYDFGIRTMPDTLHHRGWDCAESVELSRWIGEFSKRQKALFNTSGNDHSFDDLFRSVTNIRHNAVHRHRVSTKGLERFLRDAEVLTTLFGDVARTKEINILRQRMRIIMIELEHIEELLRSNSTGTLREVGALEEMRNAQETVPGLERLRDDSRDLAGKVAGNAILH